MRLIVILALMVLSACVFADSTDVKVQQSEGKTKTRYDINGRPVNQGLNVKGFHRVVGSVRLSSGTATVNLNTSTDGGKQDISFTSATTYSGRAWTLSISDRSKVYSVKPINGKKFSVVSSDTADATTVHFEVEGE